MPGSMFFRIYMYGATPIFARSLVLTVTSGVVVRFAEYRDCTEIEINLCVAIKKRRC